jgi:ABC-type transport system involved in multi-copper enzyme maturation permease subunit
MILCAACTYLTFSKIQKKIGKILSFIGVWFIGVVVTVLLGIYVSSELYDGDFSVMQRYLGSSILMPLAGCVLGAWAFAKKSKAKKTIDVASTKSFSSLILLFCASVLSLSACAPKGPLITPQDAAMNEALNVCGYTGTIDPKINECAQNVYPQILPAYMQVAQQQEQQRRADARYDMQQASQAMSDAADAFRPVTTNCSVNPGNNVFCVSH